VGNDPSGEGDPYPHHEKYNLNNNNNNNNNFIGKFCYGGNS
jgi:hypothetical protein